MSNLSDIGFPVKTEEEVNKVLEVTARYVKEVPALNGFYYQFTDESGAEIFIQTNHGQEVIGFNPHFAGKSRRTVCITERIERESSDLDGGFYAWANPQEENNPESGEYPFVFEAPDFATVGKIRFPQNFEIQLTAFASNEFEIYADEEAYFAAQNSEIKYAAQSFIPSGLFNAADAQIKLQKPLPFAIFAGTIKEFELKKNSLTQEEFWWFSVETLGGEIDVVADMNLVRETPKQEAILRGQFWLSGRIINPPDYKTLQRRILKVLN